MKMYKNITLATLCFAGAMQANHEIVQALELAALLPKAHVVSEKTKHKVHEFAEKHREKHNIQKLEQLLFLDDNGEVAFPDALKEKEEALDLLHRLAANTHLQLSEKGNTRKHSVAASNLKNDLKDAIKEQQSHEKAALTLQHAYREKKHREVSKSDALEKIQNALFLNNANEIELYHEDKQQETLDLLNTLKKTMEVELTDKRGKNSRTVSVKEIIEAIEDNIR